MDYTEWNGIAGGEYTITLQNRRELFLKIVPADRGSTQDGGATVVVKSCARSLLRSDVAGSIVITEPNLARYAVAAVVLVGLGWLGASWHYTSRLVHEQSKVKQLLAQAASHNTPAVSPQQAPPLSAPKIPTYFLTSDDPSLRGPGNPKEPVLSFASGTPLIMLNLSLAQAEHGSYRATLTSFIEERVIMTEDSLNPIRKNGQWVVEFALPSSLVADQTHYLITLATPDNLGRPTPVTRFLFKVRK
jgi:hypothetical protein